jgi:hypothetical protein
VLDVSECSAIMSIKIALVTFNAGQVKVSVSKLKPRRSQARRRDKEKGVSKRVKENATFEKYYFPKSIRLNRIQKAADISCLNP